MVPAPARPCQKPRAAAPAMAGLSTPGRCVHGACGRLEGPVGKASRSHGPCRPPGLRGHRRRGPSGHLRRPAADDGAGRRALHGRSRHLRADRQGREVHALRSQRSGAIEEYPAQPSHQHCERPDRPVPHLHAALLRTHVEEPYRPRPLVCCP